MPQEDLIATLARIVPAERLLTRPGALAAYESDGLTSFRSRPRAVVIAESRQDVVDAVRAAGFRYVALDLAGIQSGSFTLAQLHVRA